MAGHDIVLHYRPSLAAELYRAKLLLRQRRELPNNLIELPGFRFSAPLRQSTPEVHREFLRGMFQLIAAALTEVAPANQWTFVSLAEFTHGDGQIGFVFYCPFKRLVNEVHRQAEHAKQNRSLAVALDVERRIALPENTLVPVVFVYEPQRKHLLLTNENHVAAPEQFLKPQLAHNTSGFLNFIGALSCANALQDDKTYLANLLNISETAVNSGLDEWLRWFYYLVDTRKLFYSDLLLVDPERPETYYYDYSSGSGSTPTTSRPK